MSKVTRGWVSSVFNKFNESISKVNEIITVKLRNGTLFELLSKFWSVCEWNGCGKSFPYKVN